MLEAELMERDGWSRDDLLAFQRERARALIMHAVSRSPYYRDVLGAYAAERPLAELPTLSKATLMAEFDRVVTDPQLRLSDLRAHLGSADPSQSFLGALVAALNAQQPEVLVGAAGVWRALADEQLAGRLRIAPRAAFFSSEPLTADLRRRVRDTWGIEPASGYAATEAPTIAASSPEHPEMEIAEDVVVIEIVDENSQAVPPGQPGAKVLLTNLINYALPLIRYELTDSVVESPLPNPAGRPWRCLVSVDGRTADILYFPGNDGGTVAVHPSVLGSAVAPIAEVGEYAFIDDAKGLHAQVVLAPGAAAEVPDRLREALVGAIASTGAQPPVVDVQPVAALEREPGGKIRVVRSA
jgi:phenylacetate-coenzyme A ligase PaaK-like adenylate-forming protein